MVNPNVEASRKQLSSAELKKYFGKGTIINDERRRRPLWFDGRFLDAQALNAEQQYFLSRQADIARVVGLGVIQGLMVERATSKARSVKIAAGHGVTPAGELVFLPNDIEIDLGDVADNEQLDASFGLAKLPRQSMRNRSGIFIIALRPVEYTAEPIASYPTSINGKRSVEDGSIIEGTAITLIPYPDQGARTELMQRRTYVAKEIFLDGSKKSQPTGVLPLAMVALSLGTIQWLDPYLVRREVGAAEHDIFGLGLSPRVLREAFLLQYYYHLVDILHAQKNGDTRFPASEQFAAIPSAGPMPAAAINAADFTQSYFPAETNVDLSIIPEDELPSMLEESFSLPPIDLNASAEEYESTSIMVMIPVPRPKIRKLSLSLRTLIQPLKAVAPGLIAKRSPLLAITDLAIRRISFATTEVTATSPEVSAWREILESTDTLWYTRRRNIHYKAEIVSPPITLLRDEKENEDEVNERITQIKLTSKLEAINKLGTTLARAEIMTSLARKTFITGSPTLTKAVVNELGTLQTVNRGAVVKINERFSENKFGEGVARLETLDNKLTGDTNVVKSVVASNKVPELDRISRELPDTDLKVFSKKLIEAGSGTTPQPEKVANLIDTTLKDLKAPLSLLKPLR